MPKSIHMILSALVATLTACSQVSTQSKVNQLQLAQEDYEQQRYEQSVQKLLPIARAGDAKAQYALGYLYYYGKGIAKDLTIAKIWIRNAAAQDYEPARKALAQLSNYDAMNINQDPNANLVEPEQLH